MAAKAQREGRVLEEHAPAEHARRLLEWCRDLVARDEVPADMVFDDVGYAYLEMCEALGWRVGSWVLVGARFTKLTGGKKYRRCFDPATGIKSAKERVYRIRPAAAPRKGEPLRLAA